VTQTYRLFIAIELPLSLHSIVQDTIEAVRKRIPPGAVRWGRPEAMHLTLKFLGDAPVGQVEALHRQLEAAASGHASFTVAIRGVGCFPNFSRPTVIWLGLENPSGQLRALRDAVESHISPLGYPTEDRDFSPHLTLGRVKRDLAKPVLVEIGQKIKEAKIGKLAEWPCEMVRLMRSELRPDGPHYTCLAEAGLID
jgi:2'-5' RNA ligase